MSASILLSLALQQQPSPEAGLITLVLLVAFYAFFSISFQKIAEKTNTDRAWWAWVPILNLFLILKIAKRPLWWSILLLIPLVNLVISIILLVDICRARSKSPAWAVGLLLPFVNFVSLGYLAFSE